MNSIDSISKTSIKLLLAEPFYGHFMMGLPKEMSSQVDTAAVSMMNQQTIKLMVNESFWNTLNDDHRYGLIKHELLHIVLKHFFTGKSFPNKRLFNIAADLVVNQYIERKQLPEGELLIEQFTYLRPMYKIVLERDKDVAYYYKQLDQVFKKSALLGFETAVSTLHPSETKGEPQVQLSPLLQQPNPELERHKYWEQFDKLSEGERKIAEYQANRIIRQATDRVKHKYQNYGNLPKGLIAKLAKILEDMEPRFNWRRLLRLFATSSNSSFIKNTIRRPSKRYGSVPGIKVKRRNRLLLAIDTSGSIRQKELLDFFTEIYFIWRQGSEIRVVECDTLIHKTYDYAGVPPAEIHGRGGTSFSAPIEYGNTTYRPDALIYFTDGHAPTPKVAARFPILWIISSDGINEGEGNWKQFPGKILKMN